MQMYLNVCKLKNALDLKRIIKLMLFNNTIACMFHAGFCCYLYKKSYGRTKEA